MFRSRSKKIFRDVWSRKGRTALVSIAVFIGVLGVVALFSTGDLLIRQLSSDLKQDELAMLRVFVSPKSEAEVDNAAVLETLRQLPGVTEVQGNAIYPISWKVPGEGKFTEGYVRAFSVPFEEVPLEAPRTTAEGRYPNPGQKELAIERRMATKYGLKPGDQLVLRVTAGGSAGVQEETWTIAGVLFHSYSYFGASGFVPNNVSVYTHYDDAQYIAGFTGFNSIYARYTDFAAAEQGADRFAAAVREESPYIVGLNWVEDPAQNQFIEISAQYTGVLSILAVVAMVVSGFLVTNVISTIVLEQKRQIGVMKSLGATRADNFMMYAGIAFVYGLIGMVPGVLLGVPLGFKLAQYTAQFPNSLIEEFAISPLGVGMGISMGLILPVLAAALPVFKGTRVTVLEAMTDLGIASSYGTSRSARLISALPLPVNVRQALANVVQKKGRLVLTVATLMFAVAAFMGVFAVFSSLDRAISGIFDAYGFEIQATPVNPLDFDTVRALVLDEVPGVQDVFPGVGASMEVEGYQDQMSGTSQLQVLGIDPATNTFRLNLAEGTAWQDDATRDGIVLTSSLADQLGKKAGDPLVVTVGGKTLEMEVIGIDQFPFDQGLVEWRSLARMNGQLLGVPKPNEYTLPVQVEGYAGSLPGGHTVAIGFDEQVSGFMSYDAGAGFSAGQPGVIVSTDLAENGGYQVGDSLTLQVADTRRTYPVTGIFRMPPQLAAAGAPDEVVGLFWQELAALEGRSLEGEPTPSALFIRLEDPDLTADQVDERMEAVREVLLEHGITANYSNQVAAAEAAAQQIVAFGVMFNMTSAVMAAVGAIGLLTTLSMSVFERQKEIGVMRSIGAGSGTVAGQFLIEGILVGVIAWAIGAPLSYLLGLGLLKAMPFGFVEYQYPLVNLAIGLVGMVVIATIASLWPSIRAARKTVSEIIRYQ